MSQHFQFSTILSAILIFVVVANGCKIQKDPITHNTQDQYIEARKKLIQSYHSNSISYDEELTKDELQLEQYLRQIQNDLLSQYKSTHYFPPARNFYGSKDHVESTELFNIIKKMPKGGALHIHTSAMGDLDWIIEKAKGMKDMHIYWPEDDHIKKGSLRAYGSNDVPDGFIRAQTILMDKQDLHEFKSYFLFDQSFDQDSVDIWGRFESIFGRLHGFVNYEEIFEDYLQHGLSLLADDGVQHVELRMPFENHMYGIDSPTDVK